MEIVLIVILLFFVVVGIAAWHSGGPKRAQPKGLVESKPFKYRYTLKKSLVTSTEKDFFMRLDSIVGEKYYVFPQVHLSSLFDHKQEGQGWKYALGHINSKSVDYVICDKENLRPAYAIELDDYTHLRGARIERDVEVNRIFAEAGMPLVRIKDKDATDEQIIYALKEARINSESI